MEVKTVQPAFIADGMLGTTARKLRILGYDTLYDTTSSDPDLILVVLSSGRTLLTNDHELFVHAKGRKANAILVKETKEEGKLHRVLLKSGVRKIEVDRLNSRCSICNGELVDSAEITDSGSKIYYCSSCGKRYWKGSHWRKMILLFEEVNSMLNNKEI
jgi:uncharacterized protein